MHIVFKLYWNETEHIIFVVVVIGDGYVSLKIKSIQTKKIKNLEKL